MKRWIAGFAALLTLAALIDHALPQGFGFGWSGSFNAPTTSAPINTVAPAISGAPYQGATISVSTGTWQYASSFSYQWYRQTLATVNGLPNNTVLTPIAGATNPSYVVQGADVGAWLLPFVSASNGAGVTGSIPVYPVGTIPASQSAAPSGTASLNASPGIVGSAVSITTGTFSNGVLFFNYQWCSDNSSAYPVQGVCPTGYAQIPGATARTYVIQTADQGPAAGGTGHLVGMVQAVNAFCGPTVSSCPWFEAEFAGYLPIPVPYSTIVPAAGANPITVTGAPAVGNTISLTQAQNEPCNNSSSLYKAWSNPGSPNGALTCSYQWQDCNGTTCSNIPTIAQTTPCTTCGGAGLSYALNKNDVGYAIRLVVTGCNNAGCGTQCSDFASGNIPCGTIPSTPVVPAEPASAPVLSAPTISITSTCSTSVIETSPVVGYCLKAAPGGGSNSPLNYTWQWYQGAPGSGTAIAGATSWEHALVAADAGSTIYVEATAQNDAGVSAPVDSAQTATVTESPPGVTTLPTITGNPVQGGLLQVSNGSWTNSPTGYSQSWNGAGSPTNQPTYTIVPADLGNTITAIVTATNSAGSAPASSGPTAVVTNPGGLETNSSPPFITGVQNVGATLTAAAGVWSGGSSASATAACTGSTATYTLPAAPSTINVAAGSTVKVSGFATYPAYNGNFLVSSVSGNSFNVSVGGCPAGGDTGGSALGPPPSVTYTFFWYSFGVLVKTQTSPTDSTYVPVATDNGGAITVKVAAANAIGTAPPVTSAGATITLPPAPTASQGPGWSAAAINLVSGGTNYAPATYAISPGGSGSCTTEPNYGLWVNHGAGTAGPITFVYFFGAGTGCLTPPVVNYGAYGSGSGASITITLNNTPYVGQPITWSNGVWGPTTSPITYSYAVCSIPTSQTFDPTCAHGVLIGMSTQASYIPRQSDFGNNLYFLVYASNAGGTSTASVEGAAPVANAPVPTMLSSSADVYQPPAIFGKAEVGNDLVASLGSWVVGGSGLGSLQAPTGNNRVYPVVPAFSFQWYQGTPGSGAAISCATYPNACRQIYTLQPGDLGKTIYVGVVANTSGGSSAEVDSAATASVAAFPYPSGGCGGWASSTKYDGCAHAPSASTALAPYQVQHSNFFSGYAQQVGQSYASANGCKSQAHCHPKWAVAGVDYPVGVSTTGTCSSPTATNGCFAQPGANSDPTYGLPSAYASITGPEPLYATSAALTAAWPTASAGLSFYVGTSPCPSSSCSLYSYVGGAWVNEGAVSTINPNYHGNPANCSQDINSNGSFSASWSAGVLTLTNTGGTTYIGGMVQLSGFTPSSLNGVYTGVIGDQVVKNASFTLPVANNPGAITAGSVLAFMNVISCPGPTNQAVEIGTMDFSYQGNPGGMALSLQIGAGVTGPCNIHDNYLPIDLNSSHMPNASAVNIMPGCSALSVTNNKLKIRDPLNPTNNNPMWYGYDNGNLVWMASTGATTNALSGNRPSIFDYNSFEHCNARCIAANVFDIRHSFYEGVNFNAPGASSAHGDGIIATGYNGPTGQQFAEICDCSGFDQTVERFDTWLMPSYGAGTTTCLTCVAIQVPAFTMYGWSSGDNLLHITSITATAPNWPDVGATIGSGLNSYTEPYGAILGCKTAAGVSGCNFGQAASCSPTAPCIYTMTSNFQPCFATQAACAYNFNYPADWNDVEYTDNTYVTNLLNATGSGLEAPGGPGGGGTSTITYMSYMRVSNGMFSDNYIDPCGSTTNNPTTGWPYTLCPATPYPALPSFGATGAANLSMISSDNVFMENGQCIPVFGETAPPTDCF